MNVQHYLKDNKQLTYTQTAATSFRGL